MNDITARMEIEARLLVSLEHHADDWRTEQQTNEENWCYLANRKLNVALVHRQSAEYVFDMKIQTLDSLHVKADWYPVFDHKGVKIDHDYSKPTTVKEWYMIKAIQVPKVTLKIPDACIPWKRASDAILAILAREEREHQAAMIKHNQTLEHAVLTAMRSNSDK